MTVNERRRRPARPMAKGVPVTTGQRLQKILAERGVASRRAAEVLITEGRVSVEGKVVTALGTRVDPAARIIVDGVATKRAVHRYVLLNKPLGVLSTARDERGRTTVVSLVKARERLYPVGRLDADSGGLLLLTNDGAWAERVLHPRYGHEREYDVAVRGKITPEALEALVKGVRLEEGIARAAKVTPRARDNSGGTLSIIVRTGWKRQVRRMCAAVGLPVVKLNRVRLGPLRLGRLAPGAWRELTTPEVRALNGADA